MLVGVTMVRDEADIIGPVLRHLLAEGVDHLIVADNLSVDDTPRILAGLAEESGRLTILPDPVVAYEQARKMSGLARKAWEMGAEWVLPFDADEVWYGVDPHTGGPCRIADALALIDDDVQVIRAPGWDHIFTAPANSMRAFVEGYTTDLALTFSPYRRPQTQKLAKVAFRAQPEAKLHMGNHDVDLPGRSIIGPLAFRHFQYRSLEQMTRKLRNGREAYEASDIHPLHGTHWRSGGLKSDDELAADWAELCSEEGLVFDPAPLRVEVEA